MKQSNKTQRVWARKVKLSMEASLHMQIEHVHWNVDTSNTLWPYKGVFRIALGSTTGVFLKKNATDK